MFVCASTECFPDLGPQETLEALVDLQFTALEIALHEKDGWLKPSEVASNLEQAVQLCGATHRMVVGALSVQIDAEGDEYYRQFEAICKLAKAIKVVTIVVPSSELGTPFNEEIERLKKLVAFAELEGAVVALKTEIGCMTQDPDTAVVFCDHVKGLGLSLDLTCYHTGPHQGRSIDKVMPYVRHTHLRDSKKDELQVRVGQGELDYGKLVTQLEREKYRRGLSVHMQPLEEFDHQAEMRKIRLLLDSLL